MRFIDFPIITDKFSNRTEPSVNFITETKPNGCPWRVAEQSSGLNLDPKVPGSNLGHGGEERRLNAWWTLG